jgi:hypothetical protein
MAVQSNNTIGLRPFSLSLFFFFFFFFFFFSLSLAVVKYEDLPSLFTFCELTSDPGQNPLVRSISRRSSFPSFSGRAENAPLIFLPACSDRPVRHQGRKTGKRKEKRNKLKSATAGMNPAHRCQRRVK